MITDALKNVLAIALLSGAVAVCGCGANNTAQEPDDIPPMPSSGPGEIGSGPSSTPPPPAPPS